MNEESSRPEARSWASLIMCWVTEPGLGLAETTATFTGGAAGRGRLNHCPGYPREKIVSVEPLRRVFLHETPFARASAISRWAIS